MKTMTYLVSDSIYNVFDLVDHLVVRGADGAHEGETCCLAALLPLRLLYGEYDV